MTDYDTPPETPELRSDRLKRRNITMIPYKRLTPFVFSSSIESLNSTLSHNSNNHDNEIRNNDQPSPATVSTNGQDMVRPILGER